MNILKKVFNKDAPKLEDQRKFAYNFERKEFANKSNPYIDRLQSIVKSDTDYSDISFVVVTSGIQNAHQPQLDCKNALWVDFSFAQYELCILLRICNFEPNNDGPLEIIDVKIVTEVVQLQKSGKTDARAKFNTRSKRIKEC